ncbi:type II toxin-antitoxin system VapC family toxin [Candidatus Woesebacteria bacterium]|nr:type II toxin-antitoxin system VapC family toxin [Candidatus Woesebacteria bacterium]
MNNVVDSSAWLEYFADTKFSKHFADVIQDVEHLIIPTICLYEVYKIVTFQSDEESARTVIAHMQLGNVVDLDQTIAIQAAEASRTYKLPMADSIILATGLSCDATVWTMDIDFKGIQNVRYIAKK